MPEIIQGDGQNNDYADHGLLPVSGHVQQHKAVSQHAHDGRADDGAYDASRAACQTGAADNGGGDCIHLISDACR